MPAHAKEPKRRRPKNVPKNATPEQAATLTAATQRRRHISAKQRAFIVRFVEGGQRDPYQAAKDVGIVRASDADKLVVRLHDLIEAENLRRSMGRQMEVDEALQEVARLARTRDDPKIQHAALRTVLEVHGVLTGAPRVDRREAMRTIHQLVGAIREKIRAGGKVRVKVGTETKRDVVEVETSGDGLPEPVSAVLAPK